MGPGQIGSLGGAAWPRSGGPRREVDGLLSHVRCRASILNMVSAPEESLSSLIALQPNEDDRYSKMADIGGAVLELFRVAREARINAK